MKSTQLHLDPLLKSDFPITWEVLESGLDDGVAPGFVAGFWSKDHPDQIIGNAWGHRRLEPSLSSMTIETPFDLASITKVFATATLAALFVERGWLEWTTPLEVFLPSYGGSGIEIRHLLSHTAGFQAWSPFWEKLRDHFAPDPLYCVSVEKRKSLMKNLVCSILPEKAPGEQVVYSDISFLLLGYALEEIAQMPLEKAVRLFLWNPMGIEGAFYRTVNRSPQQGILESVAATENCPWRGSVLQGQVHDDNCWAMGGVGGHAGAFGCLRDVLHFSRGLMNGFLSDKTLKAMWTRVDQPMGCERTLGWDTPSGSASSAGVFFSKNTVGHLGFTGTSLWIDVDVQLAVVLLSNRVHPTRENTKMVAFRARFHDAIRRDLMSHSSTIR